MVLDDCLSYAFRRLDRSQDIVADERMSLNQAVFLGCELALFLKNEVVNPYLTDVMENGCMFEELDLPEIEADKLAEFDRCNPHPFRMTLCEPVARFKRIYEGLYSG